MKATTSKKVKGTPRSFGIVPLKKEPAIPALEVAEHNFGKAKAQALKEAVHQIDTLLTSLVSLTDHTEIKVHESTLVTLREERNRLTGSNSDSGRKQWDCHISECIKGTRTFTQHDSSHVIPVEVDDDFVW